MVTVLFPSTVIRVVVILVKRFPVGIIPVVLVGTVGPGVTVALYGKVGPPVGNIVTVLLLPTVVKVVVMLVRMLPVGVPAVVLTDAVGPRVTVTLYGEVGPPVGKMVTVLLPSTVVRVVVMFVKMFPVGVLAVMLAGTVGPGVTVAL